jgi:hypothetical protein
MELDHDQQIFSNYLSSQREIFECDNTGVLKVCGDHKEQEEQEEVKEVKEVKEEIKNDNVFFTDEQLCQRFFDSVNVNDLPSLKECLRFLPDFYQYCGEVKNVPSVEMARFLSNSGFHLETDTNSDLRIIYEAYPNLKEFSELALAKTKTGNFIEFSFCNQIILIPYDYYTDKLVSDFIFQEFVILHKNMLSQTGITTDLCSLICEYVITDLNYCQNVLRGKIVKIQENTPTNSHKSLDWKESICLFGVTSVICGMINSHKSLDWKRSICLFGVTSVICRMIAKIGLK